MEEDAPSPVFLDVVHHLDTRGYAIVITSVLLVAASLGVQLGYACHSGPGGDRFTRLPTTTVIFVL